jgi:hypothetical protein
MAQPLKTLPSPGLSRSLRFPYVLAPSPSLCCSGFFALRDIELGARFESVARNVPRLAAEVA